MPPLPDRRSLQAGMILLALCVLNLGACSRSEAPTGSQTPFAAPGQWLLVNYWAEWCGPCKMIAPILDEIANEYGDRLKVAKLNIDENQSTPPKYGIRGIPTLMLFKNGNIEATKVGALSKSQLTAFIDSHI